MKKFKLSILVLALAASICFIGCNDPEPETPAPKPTEKTETTKTVSSKADADAVVAEIMTRAPEDPLLSMVIDLTKSSSKKSDGPQLNDPEATASRILKNAIRAAATSASSEEEENKLLQLYFLVDYLEDDEFLATLPEDLKEFIDEIFEFVELKDTTFTEAGTTNKSLKKSFKACSVKIPGFENSIKPSFSDTSVDFNITYNVLEQNSTFAKRTTDFSLKAKTGVQLDIDTAALLKDLDEEGTSILTGASVKVNADVDIDPEDTYFNQELIEDPSEVVLNLKSDVTSEASVAFNLPSSYAGKIKATVSIGSKKSGISAQELQNALEIWDTLPKLAGAGKIKGISKSETTSSEEESEEEEDEDEIDIPAFLDSLIKLSIKVDFCDTNGTSTYTYLNITKPSELYTLISSYQPEIK